MGKVVLPRVDHDAAHGDVPRCWVCHQVWPHAFSLILDAHNTQLRIDGAAPIKVRPSTARALAVLINAMPRWVTRSHLVESACDDMPSIDMPSACSVTNAVADARKILVGSRYTIENDRKGRGFRLIDEDTLNRERREALAILPKKSKPHDMAVLSLGATKKTKGAPGKPSYRDKEIAKNKQLPFLQSRPGVKISTKSTQRQKKRTAADV